VLSSITYNSQLSEMLLWLGCERFEVVGYGAEGATQLIMIEIALSSAHGIDRNKASLT